MSIKLPLGYSQGQPKVHNFPKVQYSKIVELINAVNNLTDGSITTDTLTLTSNLNVGGDSILTGNLDVLGTTKLKGGLVITKDSVTQTGTINTTVISNASAGIVTTVSATLAAGSTALFKVTNSKALLTSSVQLTIDDKLSTGRAYASVQDIANGEFYIKLANIHPSVAFNNIIKIHYLIV